MSDTTDPATGTDPMSSDTATTVRPPASASAPAPSGDGSPTGHRWSVAGEAWSRRARDWSCLFEHYALDVICAAFPRVGVAPGVRLLDIACGSGLAVRIAAGAGADVAGIDAAPTLVEIARERTPSADLRVGTMFELPWPDRSFDAAVSFNGIWGGCEAALIEANRVLVEGAPFALSFWGDGDLALRPCFQVFARLVSEGARDGMRRTNRIARPGVAEEMLEGAGFEVTERCARVSTIEWPDDETAWRAISSIGPAVPALEAVGAEVLRREVLAALEPARGPDGSYRFRNDHQLVVARRS